MRKAALSERRGDMEDSPVALLLASSDPDNLLATDDLFGDLNDGRSHGSVGYEGGID